MKKTKNAVPIPKYNWGLSRQTIGDMGASLTKKSFQKDTDVNQIVRRFDRTGVVTHLQSLQGVYADVSDISSYRDAIETVRDAQGAFYELPSGLRDHFDNDPAAYVDWAVSATDEDRHELVSAITGADRTADPLPPAPAEPPETGD